MEEINEKVTAVGKRIATLKKEIEEMENGFQRIEEYWEGEAGKAHQELRKEVSEDITAMVEELEQRYTKISCDRNGKITKEEKIEEIPVQLPKDILQ